MSRDLDYVKYDETSITQQEVFKDSFNEILAMINSLGAGRAQLIARAKTEEAYMWIGKAIRDNQIQRNGSAELQEERKDG